MIQLELFDEVDLSPQLFIVDIGNGRCLIHDGYIQLGLMSHSIETHLRLASHINWQITYWIPDTFSVRYPRVNYQHTVRCNEGSPRTDNAVDNRPRDFPDQAVNRLERTL